MTTAFMLAIFFLAATCIAAQEEDDLPVRLQTASAQGEMCPSGETLDPIRNEIASSLVDTIIPVLDGTTQQSHCNAMSLQCGNPTSAWRKIAYLWMNDPTQQCPPNWVETTTPVRACGAPTGESCASAVFPSGGEPYSQVCGRVLGYQKGTPEAFLPSIALARPGLEGGYLDGVSLTHGPPGSRQHIWSFAAALYDPAVYLDDTWGACACTNTNVDWPYEIPPFVGDFYFCDTGNPGPDWSRTEVYGDDSLWEGTGCGPDSTCCDLNNVPWFCTILPRPTTDDLELRICNDSPLSDEDTLVYLYDISVM